MRLYFPIDLEPQTDSVRLLCVPNIQLTERLATLGIMGVKLKVPSKPLEHLSIMVFRDLKGALVMPDFRTAEVGFYSMTTR